MFYAVLESRDNGRLLSYDPVSGDTAVVVDKLAFANSVELSHDKKSLIVTETTRVRVVR